MIFHIIYFFVFISSGIAAKFQKDVFVHYMPWFETPDFQGYWGWHWKMNSKNPDIILPNGQREIASHYYPLIGPYASNDPDVLEYHFLLMKASGITGIILNWYGIAGSNGDIQSLLTNSNAIIAALEKTDLKFAIMMEDRFARSIEDARRNVEYIQMNYFSKSCYARHVQISYNL